MFSVATSLKHMLVVITRVMGVHLSSLYCVCVCVCLYSVYMYMRVYCGFPFIPVAMVI